MAIRIQAFKTRKVVERGDDLFSYLKQIPVKERSVLAVSSKIVSLWEGSVVKKNGALDSLVKKEAEQYIDRRHIPGQHALLTIKNHTLTASAGVDEFNGYYLLWPKSPETSAKRIWEFLRKKNKLKEFGVIITDSHTAPLRRGIVGFGLAYWGISPLRRYAGRTSVLGRTMKATQANVLDGMAAAAVLAMGEGGERTPFAVLSGELDVQFVEGEYQPKGKFQRFQVPVAEDLYQPLLSGQKWKKGGQVNKKRRSPFF